jgi:hypothetical protein
MEPELLRTAIQALVGAMTTDAWNAARSRFVNLVTRSKRQEVARRLDARARRVRRAPAGQAAEAESLADELRPIIDSEHITPAHFEQFIKSVTVLVAEARPAISASAAFVEGDQFNFHQAVHEPARAGEPEPAAGSFRNLRQQAEYAGMLRQVTMALKDSAASQRVLTSEIVALSRVARESQEEAHTARSAVLMMTAIVIDLRRRISDLERERDELLDRLGKEARPGMGVADLQRRLADAQQDVRRFNDLYAKTQQELIQARQQQAAAERLADEALDRLARYEHAEGTQPDLEEYERALDDLVDGREGHEERLGEIEQELRGFPPSLPPPSGERAGPAIAGGGPDVVAEAGSVVTWPPPGRPAGQHRTGSPRRNAGKGDRSAAARAACRAFCKVIVAAVAGLALAGLAIALPAYGIAQSIRDDPYYLADMHMTGNRPAVSTSYGTCYYASCSSTTEDLSYSMRPARTVKTTFQVSDRKVRHLNTYLALADISRSCGTSPRVSYTLSSNGRQVGHGTITSSNAANIRDLAIGRHALLSFTAVLSAPSGCVLRLDMGDPTLDVLQGWLAASP